MSLSWIAFSRKLLPVIRSRSDVLPLITRYATPGETGLDRYLSRVMAQSFAVQGASEDVDRLARCAVWNEGRGHVRRVDGQWALLLIVDLTAPAPNP